MNRLVAACIRESSSALEAITMFHDFVVLCMEDKDASRLSPTMVCEALVNRLGGEITDIRDQMSGSFGWTYLGAALVVVNSTRSLVNYKASAARMRATTISRSDGSPGVVQVIAMITSVLLDGCVGTRRDRELDLLRTLRTATGNVIDDEFRA